MMNYSILKAWMMMIMLIFIGMVLQIIPIPDWAVWARPSWVFMILLFWITTASHRFGILFAWILGLLMDLLTGTLLGQHAFVFTVIAFLLMKFHPQLQKFPIWQQMAMVFVMSMLNLALSYWVMDIAGNPPQNWAYWLPAATNTLIWPWINLLLREFENRLQLAL